MCKKFFDEVITAYRDRRYYKAAMVHDEYTTQNGRDRIYTNAIIDVPDYSESSGAFRIFVQPTCHVDMAGIMSNLLLCVASNDAYDDGLFFVCGTAFTKLPLAEQLATIERELIRCDFAVKFDIRNPYDIWDGCDMGDNAVADDVTGETRLMGGYMYVALSGAFGERIAKRVMRREHDLEIKSAHIAARYQEEQGRRIDDLYVANKANIKANRKSGKVARKAVKPEAKRMAQLNTEDWKAREKKWAEEIRAAKTTRAKAAEKSTEDDGFDIPEPRVQPKKTQSKPEPKPEPEPKKVVNLDDVKKTAEKVAAEVEAVTAKIDKTDEAAATAAEETPVVVDEEKKAGDAPKSDSAEGTESIETN